MLEKIVQMDPGGEGSRLDAVIAKSGAVILLPVSDPRVTANANTPEEWEELFRSIR